MSLSFFTPYGCSIFCCASRYFSLRCAHVREMVCQHLHREHARGRLRRVRGAGPKGHLEINPALLAAMIGEPVERIQAAIDFLLSPDPNSRSSEEEGRRIVHEGAFSYRVVNHERYRAARSEEARRAQNRDAKRRQRERSKSADSQHASASVSNVSTGQPKTEDRRQKQKTEADLVGVPAKPDRPTDADRVWQRLNELRKSLSPNVRQLKLNKKDRARVDERIAESSVQDALDVLEHIADECRRNPAQLRWFNGVTPFRPDNYARTLGQLGSVEASQVTRTGLEGFDIESARRQMDAMTGMTK